MLSPSTYLSSTNLRPSSLGMPAAPLWFERVNHKLLLKKGKEHDVINFVEVLNKIFK